MKMRRTRQKKDSKGDRMVGRGAGGEQEEIMAISGWPVRWTEAKLSGR